MEHAEFHRRARREKRTPRLHFNSFAHPVERFWRGGAGVFELLGALAGGARAQPDALEQQDRVMGRALKLLRDDYFIEQRGVPVCLCEEVARHAFNLQIKLIGVQGHIVGLIGCS